MDHKWTTEKENSQIKKEYFMRKLRFNILV